MGHDFGLKPYQKAAAARIMREFDPANPGKGRDAFVLADEAGLGKTFIALQVIADMYEGAGPGNRAEHNRLNVYYMCSNQRILKQNGEKLKRYLSRQYPVQMPKMDRLSQAFRDDLEGSRGKEGIALYTMSASLLDTTHSAGAQAERSSMLQVLADVQDVDQVPLVCTCKPLAAIDPVFLQTLTRFKKKPEGGKPDTEEAIRQFLQKVTKKWVLLLQEKLNAVAAETTQEKKTGDVENENTEASADTLSGDWEDHFPYMRRVFNAYSIAKNPPHLIILDEFHKMDGVEGDSSKALGELRELIRGTDVKQLYLSATPYRFTVADREQLEEGCDDFPEDSAWTVAEADDPENDSEKETVSAFRSFDDFVRFFLQKPGEADDVIQAFNAHKKALEQLQAAPEEQKAALWKTAAGQAELLAEKLRSFMTRSERDRLAGLPPEEYGETGANSWQGMDLLRIAKDWQPDKAAYLRQIPGVYSFALKFNYKNKAFNAGSEKKSSDHRYKTLAFSEEPEKTDYLWRGTIKDGKYDLQPPKEEDWNFHPKLQAIDRNHVRGMEKLLWMPPIRPNYQAEEDSAFAGKTAEQLSKLLVFSNYQFLPRALGSLFSETVLQRNRETAKGQLFEENAIHDVLHLPFNDVKALAQLVPLQALHRPELTCDKLVAQYRTQAQSDAEWAIVEGQLWQAIGSPQVCLYRLVQKDAEQIEEIIDRWVEPLTNAFLTWAQQPERLFAKNAHTTQSAWAWYFFQNQKETDLQRIEKRGMSVKRFPWQEPACSVWRWLCQDGLALLDQADPKRILKRMLSYPEGEHDGTDARKTVLMAVLTRVLEEKIKEWLAEQDAQQPVEKLLGSRYVPSAADIREWVKEAAGTICSLYLEQTLQAMNGYFQKEPIRWALAAAGVKGGNDLLRYCANGNLQAVLEEYMFLCDNDLWKMAAQLHAIGRLEGSKVHILTETIDRNESIRAQAAALQKWVAKTPQAATVKAQICGLEKSIRAFPEVDYSALEEVLHQLRELLGMTAAEESEPPKELDQQMLAALVGQLTAIVEAGKQDLPHVRCSFSERYAADVDDSKSHNHGWEASVQQAFNSPFWPMILTTTSVAQEGLDFHQYCRRIMHYTLPSTPMALEQREGRIDRFRGYIQRLRQAKRKAASSLSWEELFADENDTGVIPGWVVPKEMCPADVPDMERILAFLPGTSEALAWERLKEAKRHYRNAIGMPDDLALVGELEAICKQLNDVHAPDAPYQLSDLFPNLTPVQTRDPQ